MTAALDHHRRRSATAAAPLRAVEGDEGHLVIVSDSAADLGNQVVTSALLELTNGAVRLVTGSALPGAGAVEDPQGRVSVHHLASLDSADRQARKQSVEQLDRLLAGATHCSVIFPDTVAEPRQLRAAVRSIALARVAARQGIDSRVIGFSWALGTNQAAVATVRAAARSGVRLFVRDDLSHIRALNDGIAGLSFAPDLGFAAVSEDVAVLSEIDTGGLPLAVIEVSASVAGADPTTDFLAVAMRLQRRGMHVLLLPSSVSLDGDLAVCDRIAAALDHQGTTVLRRHLRPREVRAVVRAARLGISGRMRFAVVALAVGTPTVALATGGDLEALMRLAGQPRLCVPSRPGFAFAVQRAIDAILVEEAEVRRAIRSRLPELVTMARASLVDLPVLHRAEEASG